MVAFATNSIRWRMKMSNTRIAIGTLIVALSLGASAVGSSSAYAKGHPAHTYQRTVESGSAFQLPTDAAGDVVNYADYQRGGAN
jgi:hypothetical protein